MSDLGDLGDLASRPGIKVNMMLADAAQVADGKLYILGGGVAMIGPRPQPLALALRIELPWDRSNIPHEWQLELFDEDGRPVQVNEKPVQVQGKFEAGRPAGMRPGTPLAVALAINITALALPPEGSYSFQLTIEGETRPEWRVSFTTRAAPQRQK